MGYRILMTICNMNVTASVVILGVLLVRFLLQKAPRVFSCALWLVVLFRLLCPISVATPISLFGVLGTQNEQTHTLEYLQWDVMTAENVPVESVDVPEPEAERSEKNEFFTCGFVPAHCLPQSRLCAKSSAEMGTSIDETAYAGWADTKKDEGNHIGKIIDTEGTVAEINEENKIANTIGRVAGVPGTEAEMNGENGTRGRAGETKAGETMAGDTQEQVSYLQMLLGLITVIWISGMTVMAVYSVVSLWELHRKVSCAVRLQGNIFLADYLATPCVLGVFHPRIYLPSSLREEEQQYILMHEQCHIRHLDYLVKMLAYIALCIYWFNPLVWIAFIFMENDMEMRCDEVVMGKMRSDIRADYCQSLLSLAIGRRMLAGISLSFGNGNLKKRVKHILNYQQFPLWKSMVAGVVCVIVVVTFCTNPVYARGGQTDNGNGDNRQTISANDFNASESEENENAPSVSEGGEQDRENVDDGAVNSVKMGNSVANSAKMNNSVENSMKMDNGAVNNKMTDNGELGDEKKGGAAVDAGQTDSGELNNGKSLNEETKESRLEKRRQRSETLTEVSMTEGWIGETYRWFVDNDLYMNGLSDLNFWGFPGRNAVPEDIDVDNWWAATRSYYDDVYIYDIQENQVLLYDRQSEKLLYTVDLEDYTTPLKPVMWAICEQDRLYFSVYVNGAGTQDSAYLACMDIENGELLWKTDSGICNSSNFLLWDGILICGYGFTDEKDFLYQIDSSTGEVLKQMEVKTMPEVLVRKDQQLYVKCYNQAYVFAYE